MAQGNQGDDLFSKLRGQLPQIFSEGAFPPIEVSVDGITVVINPLFQIISIKIQDVNLELRQLSRLEVSIVKAINQANQEVTKRAKTRLAEIIGAGV